MARSTDKGPSHAKQFKNVTLACRKIENTKREHVEAELDLSHLNMTRQSGKSEGEPGRAKKKKKGQQKFTQRGYEFDNYEINGNELDCSSFAFDKAKVYVALRNIAQELREVYKAHNEDWSKIGEVVLGDFLKRRISILAISTQQENVSIVLNDGKVCNIDPLNEVWDTFEESEFNTSTT